MLRDNPSRRIRQDRYANLYGPGKTFVVNNSPTHLQSKKYAQGVDGHYKTIREALVQCRDHRGDTIILEPDHAETISAAGGLVINKIGVTIVGRAGLVHRPTITFDTAATADIDINAAEVTIENVEFIANFADIVCPIDVNAKGFTLQDCVFTEGTNLNFLVCIQTAAANACDGLRVIGCRANCPDDANTEFLELVGACDDVVIEGNHLVGDWGVACISAITAASTNLVIVDNLIFNETTGPAIDLVAASTGFIDRNLCNCVGGTIANMIDGANCTFGDFNRVANLAGERGIVVGTAST